MQAEAAAAAAAAAAQFRLALSLITHHSSLITHSIAQMGTLCVPISCCATTSIVNFTP
jgi:hypothetical protein